MKVNVRIGEEVTTIEGVTEISQSLGDTTHFSAICSGEYGFPFPIWCPECAKARNRKGCGKRFQAFTIKGEPEPIMLTLESGETIYCDEILEGENEG